MAFSDLLEQVGSTGRFQILHVTLLSMPILMMASHNLLQNFVASVPPHHCAPYANFSMSSKGDMLRATVPLGPNGQPERCRRYAYPQWQLLNSNSSESLQEEDVEEIEMQKCEDGWYYNMTEMSSTIISEVSVKCLSIIIIISKKFAFMVTLMLITTFNNTFLKSKVCFYYMQCDLT